MINSIKKIENDITQNMSDKITEKLFKMRSLDLISEKNFEYLNPTEAKFYLLPKIHKKDIPGRLICSSINPPTSHISKFIDEHIKKYVSNTKSYVRDTQHFIRRLKQLGQIPVGASLVTLDVSSLYTNIPNHEGILAVSDQKKIKTKLAPLMETTPTSTTFSELFFQWGPLSPNWRNSHQNRSSTQLCKSFHGQI